MTPAAKADLVKRLRDEGRRVCFVGDGVSDAMAMRAAEVSISLRGPSTIAEDAAQVVLLDGRASRLCDLHEIARNLRGNARRSLAMVLAPNVACVAGAFTMGFGLMASVVANNIAALAALVDGALPLREVAQLEAERRHRQEIARAHAMGYDGSWWIGDAAGVNDERFDDAPGRLPAPAAW